MQTLEIEKFTTKAGLTGVLKHIGYGNEVPKEQIETLENLGINTNWFCGYVILPKDHKFYAKTPDVSVHGGITYESPLRDFDKESNDNGWVLGFDCNHYNDNPKKQNKEYVLNEIEKLANQLSA